MFIRKSKLEDIIVETFAEGVKAGQTSEKLFGEQSRRTPKINSLILLPMSSCGFSPIDDQTTITRNNSRRYLLKSVGVKSRNNACSILMAMDKFCIYFGRVSVADYYTLCGITSQKSDEQYGWKSTNGMRAEPRFGGYDFVLPAPIKF